MWTALDWSQFPPTTGQWPKAHLQTMQYLFREEAVSWYSVCNWVAQYSHQISTLMSCCGSSLTVWYVRSARQTNPTCGGASGSVGWNFSCQQMSTARMAKVRKAVIAANGEFFDESKVWSTKLLFQIKIIISNLVNVLTIFSIRLWIKVWVCMENMKLSGWPQTFER